MDLKVLTCCLGLVGCTTTAEVVDKAADANDAAIRAAEFTICYGASVGSIRRAYGEREAEWRTFCQMPVVE